MKYFYENVPKIGNLALSRHSQSKMKEQLVSQEMFEDTLFNGKWVEDGFDILWIEKNNIRIVIILKPEPYRNAKLVKTVYKIYPQEIAK